MKTEESRRVASCMEQLSEINAALAALSGNVVQFSPYPDPVLVEVVRTKEPA